MTIILSSAVCIALLASGIFFMTGLLTGLWKYRCIRAHPQAQAPFYVNTVHRAALMYAFSAQLIAVFAALSVLPNWLNTIAVLLLIVFFALAIIHYIQLGLSTDSNNSLRDSPNKEKDYMILNILTVAEISGFSILLLGFILRLFGIIFD
ncbi:MAG: hypothetical protein WAX77_01725 [Methylococcaceae bacterium]